MRRRLTPALAVLLTALLTALTVLAGGVTQGAYAVDDRLQGEGAPWFGPILDWTDDSAAQYADRLDIDPSLFAQSVRYPLDDDDDDYVDGFVEQASQQGSVALLTLEPSVPLDDLTADDADDLAQTVADANDDYGVLVLVRFAPEMNGSWTSWGQQPTSYVEQFRTLADAVHEATEAAAMVWAPSYGAGYPFTEAYDSGGETADDDVAALDTSGDGVVGPGDDPYAPYWPGDDVVDWVGLSLLWFGAGEPFGGNDVPPSDAFAAGLDEQLNYAPGSAPAPFYDTYAAGRGLPMVVETGALFNTEVDGGSELEIKQAWLDSVTEQRLLAEHPWLRAYAWLEVERPEDEADGDTVDWRLSHTDAVSSMAGDTLDDSRVDLGPVTRALDQEAANEATAQYRELDPDRSDQMGWIVLCVVVLAVVFLVAGLVGRYVPQWRYPREHDPRDLRLDMLRGWIIIAVVITHIEVAGAYSYVTRNAVGAITGAELFVLLSGIVLGMVYPIGVRKLGPRLAARGALLRARKQYLTALVVVVSVYLIGLLPGVRASIVTTFTDRGTGTGGEQASGQVYDLYANAPRLFDYPPPWYAVRQLLLLDMGPWVFNIMGLFVVLSALVPALAWLLQKRLWWVLLAGSWGLYVVDRIWSVTLLPSQFEDVFPLLTWQVLFTHGLVLGWYRRQIVDTLTTRAGKIAVGAAVVAYAGVLGVLWLGNAYDVAVPLVPAGLYDDLYLNLYQRVELQPGRLVDLALMTVVPYAVLTTCWVPLEKALGWLYVPMGQASLYVFIVHVYFVIAVSNVPGLSYASWWQGTLVHTVVILAIWGLVKKKVGFAFIPH